MVLTTSLFDVPFKIHYTTIVISFTRHLSKGRYNSSNLVGEMNINNINKNINMKDANSDMVLHAKLPQL